MLFDEVTSALAPELVGEVLRVMRRPAAGGPKEIFHNPSQPRTCSFLKQALEPARRCRSGGGRDSP